MTTPVYQHGQLYCGTLLVNDLDKSVSLYTDLLSQEVVEYSTIPETLAQSWAAPRLTGMQSCLLRPITDESQEDSNSITYLRLIQSPEALTPVPHATTYGWTAFEISVMDVFALAEKLEGSGFTVVGPPKRLQGISNVIPMQVVGPDQEVLYLNQILSAGEHTDVACASREVDQFFIAVLASVDRELVVQDYCQQFKLQATQTHELRYSLINRAFGFDADTKHVLTVLQEGSMPVFEIDQYPQQTSMRNVLNGSLPLGNAMVSIRVDNLDDLPLSNKVSDKVIQHQDLLYRGCRSIVVRGRSNELIELIEGVE